MDFENGDRRFGGRFRPGGTGGWRGAIDLPRRHLPGERERLSAHLRRREVGQLFSRVRCPRWNCAPRSFWVGSLSLIIRSLVERLPVMVTPAVGGVKAQPIFVDDVLAYLPFGAGGAWSVAGAGSAGRT